MPSNINFGRSVYEKPRIAILLVIGCFSITTLAFTVNTKNLFETFKPPQPLIAEPPKRNAASPRPQRAELSEHVQYYFLFRHLSAVKETPSAARFQAKAELNSGQLQALTSIAVNNERELNRLDERAKAIVNDFHSQYPPGRLPPGVAPPALPRELGVLQRQREATILRYREQLRRMLGEAEFARFDSFVKDEIGGNASTRNQ